MRQSHWQTTRSAPLGAAAPAAALALLGQPGCLLLLLLLLLSWLQGMLLCLGGCQPCRHGRVPCVDAFAVMGKANVRQKYELKLMQHRDALGPSMLERKYPRRTLASPV